MMTKLNRIFPVLMALTVSVFLMACGGDDRDLDDAGELGTETEGLEQTPTQPAPGAGMGTFTRWDTDTNRDLSEEEFGSGLRGGTRWTEWDTDANRSLNRDEFDTSFGQEEWYEEGRFEEWDTNGDGELSREEWQSGVFAALDENGDGRIQEDEFPENTFRGTSM